ncbi:MAG: lamin tail domain-containing protein [Anaerolineae bacterium]|nr:lamin tail domain-containing protein [Anaerolineae bacterium]
MVTPQFRSRLVQNRTARRKHPFQPRLLKTILASISVICFSYLIWPVGEIITPVLAAPTELFFSEYVEGSSNNKALEIYNGTGAEVDLSAYTLELYSNGSPDVSRSLRLYGTLADQHVIVIAHAKADKAILAIAAITNSTVINFNGDDAIVLKRDEYIIDVIGEIGLDPGNAWGNDPYTEDQTLRRKPFIENGDPDGLDVFNPGDEWEGYDKDDFSDLGSHTVSVPTETPTVISTEIVTPTVTATVTLTPTIIISVTATATPTLTTTPSPSSTVTATPSETVMPSPSPTTTVTETPAATATPVPIKPGAIVINEIAWSGTAADANDEWIELYNSTTQTIVLDGWIITSTNGLNIPLSGSMFPNSYYLIERTDDNAIIDTIAALTTTFGKGLLNSGDSLYLSAGNILLDTANVNGGSWPSGTNIRPDLVTSMERINPLAPDIDSNWGNNNLVTRNGRDKNGQLINGTPGQANSLFGVEPPPPTSTPPTPTSPALPILISEFLYDGETSSTEGDEFVELCNSNNVTVDLTGYKVGDEETAGGGESMYHLPDGTQLAAGDCLVIAKKAADFQDRFGFLPDLAAGDLSKYTAWGRGSWSLSNTGDELVVLGPNDQIFDSVAYRNGDYAGLGLEAGASAKSPSSLQRVWPVDTNSMPNDFVQAVPNPGVLTAPPAPPAAPSASVSLTGGMNVYWGDLHAHTTYSDGSGPPYYALAKARAAGLHFFAITDHGWWTTTSEWAKTLEQVEAATIPGEFIALRGVEWTHDIVGHINLFNTETLVSRSHPLFSDLSGLYTWLAANPQVIAQFNHPDPRYGGTFADFQYHPAAAQAISLQEIGNNAQKYTTYEASFIQSNAVGWQTAPTNNSDTHSPLWGSDTQARTGIIAPELTQAALFDALRRRRVFATEDSNLAVALRVDNQWMGSVLNKTGDVSVVVDVIDADVEAATLYLYDRNLLLKQTTVAGNHTWQTSVKARSGHFLWVKVVQADGNVAYSAPIWIAGQAAPDTIVINEVLPSPADIDWNGDGQADSDDEWIELFNPTQRRIGLGGWRLNDSSNITFSIPLSVTVPPGGYVTLYGRQLGFALNNGGDTVTLQRPDSTIADTFTYHNSPGYDESWCRAEDGGPTWSEDCTPSPNGQNWQRGPAQPLKTKIYEAKRLTLDAWVQVTGQVTAPPGVLGQRAMYIQDETAGILVYLPKNHNLHFNKGDKVRVEGNLKQFRGEFEIVVSRRSKVHFIEPGSPPPPLPIETTMMLEPFEGRLVMITGRAVGFKGRTMFWLDDGTDPAKVYIRTATGIKKPFIKSGTTMTVVGIVSQYSEAGNATRYDYRLLPREQLDLMITGEMVSNQQPKTKMNEKWPSMLPETGSK